MGLLSIIRKAKRKEREMRLLFLYACSFLVMCRGLDNAGKTTIIRKLSEESTTDISPTMGFAISTLDYQKYDYLIMYYY